VALELGFASGTAFRNMLVRYTGANCSEIRNHGGLDRVLSSFLSSLAGAAVVTTDSWNSMGVVEIRDAKRSRQAG
jgi:ornithine carbamoyltransferase